MGVWADIARSMPVKPAETRYVDLEIHARAGVLTTSVTVVADPPTLRRRLQRRAQWCLELVATVRRAVYWGSEIAERTINSLEVRITSMRSRQPRLRTNLSL